MEEYKIWFEKAEQDFDTAKYNLEGGKIEAGLFFLQQSAEKALKAFNIKLNKELIKTHDLVLLARKVKAPQDIENFCKELTAIYQYTRYPDVSNEELNPEEVEKFQKYSEEIIKWVKKNL